MCSSLHCEYFGAFGIDARVGKELGGILSKHPQIPQKPKERSAENKNETFPPKIKKNRTETEHQNLPKTH